MRNIFITVFIFMLAACAKIQVPEIDQTGTITYQVSADVQMEIKSSSETMVNVLWYGVFHKQEDEYVYMSDMSAFVEITDPELIEVPITVIKDQEYKIAFVAQYKEINEGGADDIYTYLINEKGIMSLNPAVQITPENGERMDVYVNYDIVTADFEIQRNITLCRPVAQINIGTSEMLLPENMEISLANVPASYNIFNPDSNTAYTPDNITHTFNGKPCGGVLDVEDIEYTRLASFYVLGGNSLSCTLKFTYNGSESVVRTIKDVTTVANHKTNIVGKL